jgi:TRAP-type C4-dicarboxylate transport system permease small subunit
MYVTSWTGLACALGALLLFATLPRPQQRGLAVVSMVLAVLLAFALLITAYWLYAPDPSGGYDCSGMHLLVP